jgi:hypothetical protein
MAIACFPDGRLTFGIPPQTFRRRPGYISCIFIVKCQVSGLSCGTGGPAYQFPNATIILLIACSGCESLICSFINANGFCKSANHKQSFQGAVILVVITNRSRIPQAHIRQGIPPFHIIIYACVNTIVRLYTLPMFSI